MVRMRQIFLIGPCPEMWDQVKIVTLHGRRLSLNSGNDWNPAFAGVTGSEFSGQNDRSKMFAKNKKS